MLILIFVGGYTLFKWDAMDYREHSSAQNKWAKELINKFKLHGDEKIIDIGCGDGRVTSEISSHVKHGSVLGIDNSKEMIELATKTFPKEDYPNLSFQIKDVMELDYIEEFDWVFSNAMLHWVKDHLTILKQIQRSLKPGGRILIQMGGYGNAHEILQTADDLMKNEKWNSYYKDFKFPYSFYKPDAYQNWLKKANLEPLRVELIPKVMTQNGLNGLKSWIRTTWLPYTQRLPDELKEDFINELVLKYINDHPLNEDGLVVIDMKRLEVEALKPY